MHLKMAGKRTVNFNQQREKDLFQVHPFHKMNWWQEKVRNLKN